MEEARSPLSPSTDNGLFVRTEISSSNPSLPHQDSSDSVGLESFNFHSAKSPKHEQLEKMINFVMQLPDKGEAGFSEALVRLAEFVGPTVTSLKDPGFKRTLRSFGWTGKRFQAANKMFEKEKFLQAISNLYLKYQYQNLSSMENLLDTEGINHIEKIAAFCPDIVVYCLQSNPSVVLSEIEPTTFPIKGACMLIDISGFSKFSASMCSKGAEGLDELRKTTSGMLGKLVKSVYEHEGDGRLTYS
jgi:hypothetical protein